MKNGMVLQIISAMALSTVLFSCAINETFSKSELKDEALFEGRTGVVGVIRTDFSASCTGESGEIILYGPDGKKEQIDFYMNRLFASSLIPGKHKVEEIRYRCNYSKGGRTTINVFKWFFDDENMFAKDLLQSSSGNSVYRTYIIHGDASVVVPEDGFCKFAIDPKTTGRWGGDSQVLRNGEIALDMDKIPSCR